MDMQHPHKVYVVATDQAARQMVEQIAAERGYRAQFFDSAEDFGARAQLNGSGCLLLQLNLPGASGLELQQDLIRKNAPLSVVFVGQSPRVADVVQAMRMGATDFLDVPLDRAAVESSLEDCCNKPATSQGNEAALAPRIALLTAREQEVMRLLAQGKQTKQIATELAISPKTVEKHRSKVLHKMQAHTVVDLVRMLLGQPSVDFARN
jgi:FixJ family two-component response regulator